MAQYRDNFNQQNVSTNDLPSSLKIKKFGSIFLFFRTDLLCLFFISERMAENVGLEDFKIKKEIQDTVQSKPVFDPEIHTELIIKDECENMKTGYLLFRIL